MTKKKRPNSKMIKNCSASKVIAVKKFLNLIRNINLFMFLRIQKEYFVRCTNVYEFEIELYVVFKHMLISLIEVVAILVHSKEIHITSIIDQIEFQFILFKRQY